MVLYKLSRWSPVQYSLVRSRRVQSSPIYAQLAYNTVGYSTIQFTVEYWSIGPIVTYLFKNILLDLHSSRRMRLGVTPEGALT